MTSDKLPVGCEGICDRSHSPAVERAGRDSRQAPCMKVEMPRMRTIDLSIALTASGSGGAITTGLILLKVTAKKTASMA